jgi:hypothetical protein
MSFPSTGQSYQAPHKINLSNQFYEILRLLYIPKPFVKLNYFTTNRKLAENKKETESYVPVTKHQSERLQSYFML